MATFQIAIPPNSSFPGGQWAEVASNIEAAFRACESAELSLHMMPDGAINIEVVTGPDCLDVQMKLTLTTPPWRYDG